jgi:hypothetical protein
MKTGSGMIQLCEHDAHDTSRLKVSKSEPSGDEYMVRAVQLYVLQNLNNHDV